MRSFAHMGNVYKKEAAAYRRRRSGDGDSLPAPLTDAQVNDIENVGPSSSCTPPASVVECAALDTMPVVLAAAAQQQPGSGRVLRSGGRSGGKKGPSSHGKKSAKKQASSKPASIFGDITDLFSCVSDTSSNRSENNIKRGTKAVKKPIFSCASDQHGGTPSNSTNSPANILDMIGTPPAFA
jgi:hypothetical protein